jgi:hypothetical protein
VCCGGGRGGHNGGIHSRSSRPEPVLLAIEGALPGNREGGAYWPQHHISTACLGCFSQYHGFQYDYGSHGPDDDSYN